MKYLILIGLLILFCGCTTIEFNEMKCETVDNKRVCYPVHRRYPFDDMDKR